MGVALALYTGLIGLLYVGQRSLMYQPGSHVATPAASGVDEMRPIQLQTPDGLTLTSWHAIPKDGKPTIVYAHGNAGTISDRGFKVRSYLDQGFGVLLVGYRGYGGNSGAPSEHGLYTDASTAVEHLRKEGISESDIVFYGESLGTGVAVELAHRAAVKGMPFKAVILEAPFTSMGDAAQGHYPFVPAKLLVKDKFNSISKIAAIRTPLYVFHGERDRVVPQTLGRRLFAAAKEPKIGAWIEGAHHNDLYDFGVAPGIIEFLDGL